MGGGSLPKSGKNAGGEVVPTLTQTVSTQLSTPEATNIRYQQFFGILITEFQLCCVYD